MWLLDDLAQKTGILKGMVRVIDLDQVTWAQGSYMQQQSAANKKQTERLGTCLKECYPELVSRIRIANAPSFVAGLWQMAKLLIPARTQEKIQILSISATPVSEPFPKASICMFSLGPCEPKR